MKQILFKAKRTDDGQWVEGSYVDLDIPCIFPSHIRKDRLAKFRGSKYINHTQVIGRKLIEVNRETLCQYTGHNTCKGNKVWNGTIAFEEQEFDYGDERTYYVCTYISEWSSFVWLPVNEYNAYINRGVEEIDRVFLLMSESHRLHHAGNIFDNEELLYA